LKILYIAEIVGKAGLFTLKNLLPVVKARYQPDMIVVHGDAASGGWGLGMQNAYYIRKLGVDLILLGDLAYNKKDMQELMEKSSFIIRPFNFPPEGPGKGWKIAANNEKRTGWLSLMGQNGYNRLHADSPVRAFAHAREKVHKETPFFFTDFHALSTAEKNTFFHYARGKCSAVFGSGTRVPTADANIQDGTFTMTDIGRTGSFLSCGGFEPGPEILRLSLGLHDPSEESWEGLELQGVYLELDDQGKSRHFETIRLPCLEKPHDT